MDNSQMRSGQDHNSSLLEGLFQLTVSGETAGFEFTQIEREVYARLLGTYQAGEPSRAVALA
jgi:hypothetical protein